MNKINIYIFLYIGDISKWASTVCVEGIISQEGGTPILAV